MESVEKLKKQIVKEKESCKALKEKYEESQKLVVSLENKLKNQPDYLDKESKHGFKLFRAIRRIFSWKRRGSK